MRYYIILIATLLPVLSFGQLPQLVLQRGHNAPITAIVLNSNEQYALTGSWDKSAKLWELSTGKELRTYPSCLNSFAKMSITWHPSQDFFAVGGSDGSLKIINIENGRVLHTLDNKDNDIVGLGYNKNGEELIIATSSGKIVIYDHLTGTKLEENLLSTDPITALQIGQNSNRLIFSAQNNVHILNLKTRKVQQVITTHEEKIEAIHLTDDEKIIITSGNDGYIYTWNASNGKLLQTIAKKVAPPIVMSSNDDGSQIIGIDLKGNLSLWDVQKEQNILLAKDIKNPSSLTWSNKHGVLHNNLQKFQTRSFDRLTQVHTFSGYNDELTTAFINSVTFSPDGRNMASAGGDGVVRLWGENTGMTIPVGEEIACITYRQDGEMIAAGTRSGKVWVWMSETGKLVHKFNAHQKAVTELTFLDNRRLLSSSHDKTVKLLDFSVSKDVFTFTGHQGAVLSHAISPNKKYLLSGDAQGIMRLWNLKTGDFIRQYEGTPGLVSRVRFTPDGYFVLGGGDDGFIRIWDTESGDYFYELQAHDGMVLWMDFSPRGEYLVSSGGGAINDIHLWDVLTVEFFGVLSGHTESVTTVDYSPTGQYVVSSSMDNSIKLWDVQEGELLATMFTIGNSDWAVVSPDGMFDASPGAMELMHYVVGIEPIDLVQLKERYYEPDLLQKILGYNPEPLRNVAALEQVELYPKVETSVKGFKYTVKLTPRSGGIGKVSLFINNKEIIENANPSFEEQFNIDLVEYSRFLKAGNNEIGVKVYNKKGWLSSRLMITDFDYLPPQTRGNDNNPIKLGALNKTTVPTFYGLVVGTSDYRGTTLDLSFADKDATDIANAVHLAANSLFGSDHVNMSLYTTSKNTNNQLPSKYSIIQHLQSIAQQATPKDILFIYLSGHGVTYDGQFYYLTKDLATGDLSDEEIRNNYAISTAEFTDIFKNVPASKQILILDACSSGSLVDNVISQTRNLSSSQRRALDRMKDRTGMFILAGSAANKVSYEASQFGQGLLTYSLLSGMRGAALREGEFVDIMQLFQYAADKVPEFARSIGGIQRPVIAAPSGSNSFDIGQVNDEVKAAIPLEDVKPLFVRSIFQEENSYDDPLELADLLDKQLAEISSDAAVSNMIFLDVKKYPNAFAVRGRYTMEGNEIKVSVKIFKNRTQVYTFEVNGNANDTEGIVELILWEMQAIQ